MSNYQQIVMSCGQTTVGVFWGEYGINTRMFSLRRSSGYWQYSSKQQFLQQSGSGNNWAYGYCMLGPRCQAGISDIIRKQVEQCDR